MSHIYENIAKKDCRCYENIKHEHPTASASVLIDEIMKKYFCRKAGQGSSCSLFSDLNGSVYSMDRRLLYWTQILEDRKKIACRIQKVTGKRLSHVLYNQLEDHRNMQNIKRLLDYSQRLEPGKLMTRTEQRSKDPYLFETLPKTERMQAVNFEIVGTPKVVLAEQWIHQCATCTSTFLASSILQRKLKANAPNLRKILEFYPEIDKLQVVGQRIHKHARPAAEPISDFELSSFSEDSVRESWEGQEFPDYCIQINDTILRADARMDKSLVLHLDFKCKPQETQTQILCKIRNMGKKPVYFEVRRIKPRNTAYAPDIKVFRFLQKCFRITYGEVIEVNVAFKPHEVMTRDEQWVLYTDPEFLEDTYKIIVKLSGESYIPDEYFSSMIGDLLDSVINGIIGGNVCDAQRRIVYTDRELFEKRNPGFKCLPEDLKRLNEIYRQIKQKCNPPRWDMNLQTIKEIIEGIPDFTQRTKYLALFLNIVREMRRRIPDCDANIRVLLARTLIASIFDKWEIKAAQIEKAVAKTTIDVLMIKMPFDTVVEQLKQCKSDEEKKAVIKYNALYIQMYCSLCDFAEDIVSFMENCLMLYAI